MRRNSVGTPSDLGSRSSAGETDHGADRFRADSIAQIERDLQPIAEFQADLHLRALPSFGLVSCSSMECPSRLDLRRSVQDRDRKTGNAQHRHTMSPPERWRLGLDQR